ncbi:hypothetical protein XpopCFBP1817_06170 [Xanthomonas populi]|uniref:Methyltransferase n=1 Tax=Xanthomonas populi TaxID=53414 RepID=A0A2S7EU78_9XANT|nr:hypothetical protein XpopCFBP1817_06170 [Xanthomonas populi]
MNSIDTVGGRRRRTTPPSTPDDLRAADPLGGRDWGWVNQMRPFVLHFSVPGAQVFDPFCGFGSTLLAAALEGRTAHGMEIDTARAQLARTRLQRHGVEAPVVVGMLADTAPAAAIDLCLTNVLSFGCHWRGEALPGQLYASADYAGYLSGMRAVLHGCESGDGRTASAWQWWKTSLSVGA